MPPDPGAFALRADTTPFPGLGVADREQLADGITVEFATVIDDRYTVTGRMGGLAATWSDPEWRRIAGWLRRV